MKTKENKEQTRQCRRTLRDANEEAHTEVSNFTVNRLCVNKQHLSDVNDLAVKFIYKQFLTMAFCSGQIVVIIGRLNSWLWNFL